MSVTYTASAADGHEVRYRDRKRWAWMLSVFWPLIPFIGLAAHHFSGQEIALAIPLLVSYGLMPLLDAIFGEDPNNPPDAVVRQLDADRYYRWLTWATVPLHFVALIGCAWWAATHDLSWWAFLILAYVAGTDAGLGLNTAHELGHKHNPIEQGLARLVLAVPAWVLESQRLAELGRSPWSPHNTLLQSYAITALLQGSLIAAFGWLMLPFLAIHNVVAWWQLTSANYVEHYGLLRERDPSTATGYESPKPHHSWNTNHLVTNLATFHLQRHSDHHAHPSRRYQCLRHFPDLPQLPSGYFGMFPLAYMPWAWFRVMDRRLLALPQVHGDLGRVNIDPKRRERLWARYGAVVRA